MRRSVGSVAPVRISVYDEENEENPEWQAVVIKGDPVSCFAAVRLIPLLVDDDHDADIVVEVPIHRAQHNLLVGKGGITLAALSATYETRIMIPPNEFMSNVKPPEGAQENIWETRQTQQNSHIDVGTTMLFGGENNAVNPGQPGKNIIQLEGDIDKVERCLVKILSIVAGEEKFIPTGIILPVKGIHDETYAEATIVKIWSTSDSKSLNLGKIRKVQRQTSTIIRRKKLRLRGNINIDNNGIGEKTGDVETVENENEDGGDDDEGEEDDQLLTNDEEEDVVKEDVSVKQAATKYIITGHLDSVKSAASKFEQILALEPGSAIIKEISANKIANTKAGSSKVSTTDTKQFTKEDKKQYNKEKKEQKNRKSQKRGKGSIKAGQKLKIEQEVE